MEKHKRNQAIAIKYDPEDIAPKILAKGAGVIAEKILESANREDIPIHKDPTLIKDLVKLDLGEHIPPDLYEAVAKILIFISDLDKQYESRKITSRTEGSRDRVGGVLTDRP